MIFWNLIFSVLLDLGVAPPKQADRVNLNQWSLQFLKLPRKEGYFNEVFFHESIQIPIKLICSTINIPGSY